MTVNNQIGDTLIEVSVFGTSGSVAVLIHNEVLAILKAKGAEVGRMLVHLDGKDAIGYKSPEILWDVKGKRRNVPVAHIIHGVVGQRRRVRYQSTDDRVISPRLDLRVSTHHVGEPGRTRRGKTKPIVPIGPRFTVEQVTHYQVLDRGELVLDGYETEADAKAAAFDLL